MKHPPKLLFTLLGAILALSTAAYAVDSLTILNPTGNYRSVVYNWTSDAAGAATGVTAGVLPGVLYKAYTVPGAGAAAPTDDYDITIQEQQETSTGTWEVVGTDVATAELDNRDTADTEVVDLTNTAVKPVSGKLQINIANAGDSNSGRLILIVYALQFAKRDIPPGGPVDISSDTNLTVVSPIVLTGDQLSHASSAGSVHVPTGGASAQILQFAVNGTAKWIDISNDISLADGGIVTITAGAIANGDEIANGLITAAHLAANSVEASEVAFNYVASVTNSKGLTIANGSGGEGLATTVGFNYNAVVPGGDLAASASDVVFSTNGIFFEGATADAAETFLRPTDATGSDADILLPNASGTVALKTTKALLLTAAGGDGTVTAGSASATKVEIGTNKRNKWVLDFDKDTDENCFWDILALPADFTASGTFTVTIVWTAASGTGDVIVNIAAVSCANDDTLDVALGTAATATDTLLAANDMHSVATGTLTAAGTPAAGENLMIEVKRDADNVSDTLDADARLIGVKLEYTPSV